MKYFNNADRVKEFRDLSEGLIQVCIAITQLNN